MNQASLATIHQVGPDLPSPVLELRVLEAFDLRPPGEHVTLVTERAPGAVLVRFQAERKGEFEWTPTKEGPDIWWVEVSRREAERGALRTVTDALSWDHDRLDALESAAFEARARGDFAEAASLYAVFAFGLRRHIRFEEDLLFPAFENKAGFSSTMGPTAVMRDEHLEILQCLERIEAAIGDGASAVDSLRHGLHLVLGNHNLKEENIVYPGTDEAMTPIERDALVARIQAL
ncbi:MAG: hemerythrin domain-containing protein [Vicinamibacteria bacterium]|nr:hemerythrin domain-containing protein [Vicinamibacteria bacterium]